MSFGYRHDVLNEYGAFWASGAKTIRPLKNDIHPLWKQDKFRMGGYAELQARCEKGLQWDEPGSAMPDNLYKTIEPALRLASMFVGQSRQFFMMILRAKEVPVKGINVLVREGLLKDRMALQCLDPTWIPSAEDERAFDEAIEEIAGYFRIYCGEDSRTIMPGNLVFASTSTSIQPSTWIYNFFSRDYFEEFTSSRFRHGSVQQRHRLLFLFTVTLLHELAHVMLRKKRAHDAVRQVMMRSLINPEPLFTPEDVTAELGHAWETWAFGGTMYPTGYPLDLRTFGLRWYPWLWPLHAENTLCLDYPYGEFIIHASSMSKFFSSAGWEGHRNDVQPLVVELTPLRALSGNVEDKTDDDYDRDFRSRLEYVYLGMSSASFRNCNPMTPPLPTLEMDTDVEMMMSGSRSTGKKMLRRRIGRLGKGRSK